MKPLGRTDDGEQISDAGKTIHCCQTVGLLNAIRTVPHAAAIWAGVAALSSIVDASLA
jgi:hypothetical protein